VTGGGQKQVSKEVTSSAEILYWTCSMHPQVKLPNMGQCPICTMDLISVKADDGDDEGNSDRRLVMSLSAQKLAQIQTDIVERKFISSQIRMTGKVAYNETKVISITSWVSGRLDRLYVDSLGVALKKGDHIGLVYSPELLAAQEEYLQAIASIDDVKESPLDVIKESSETMLVNAKEKLRLLGITEFQIEQIAQTKEIYEKMTIYSSSSGIVLSKEKKEGDYVKRGERLYSLADLSEVWVVFDVYESDLSWIHFGQEVSFVTEAWPGEIFEGVISFVSPIVDEKTRTIKVRVNMHNKEGLLKPGMFVRGIVEAFISESGKVINDRFAGKWISPMHPEIVKDEPGSCDICGMNLVSAESLGFTSSNEKAPLVIPATAPLKTGSRAVVYVEVPHSQRPTYEGREIVLGARLGDYYVVKQGLKEGERVVIHGNFKIDSAIQIKAGTSMMNPAEENIVEEKRLSIPLAFLSQLTMIYDSYFKVQEALAQDNLSLAKRNVMDIEKYIEDIKSDLLPTVSKKIWLDLSGGMLKSLEHLKHVKNIEDLRFMVFKTISTIVIEIEARFGHQEGKPYYEVFCPMALDNKGGNWLQQTDMVANPYFGSAMLDCGAVKMTFEARKTKKKPKRSIHEGSHH
jgi:Cu(I)/Ag(I) efflux system membrane fusion protein